MEAQERRKGRKRALIALELTILVIIYRMLSQHQSYEELGSKYFDERDRHNKEKRLVRRLEKLGYKVDLFLHPPEVETSSCFFRRGNAHIRVVSPIGRG